MEFDTSFFSVHACFASPMQVLVFRTVKSDNSATLHFIVKSSIKNLHIHCLHHDGWLLTKMQPKARDTTSLSTATNSNNRKCRWAFHPCLFLKTFSHLFLNVTNSIVMPLSAPLCMSQPTDTVSKCWLISQSAMTNSSSGCEHGWEFPHIFFKVHSHS